MSLLAPDVPKRSGIYSISKVRRSYGLPLEKEVIYIGKSKNLQRRYVEHVNPIREKNAKLSELLSHYRNESLEFWYIQVPEQSLDFIEKELIKKANPIANILHKETNHE